MAEKGDIPSDNVSLPPTYASSETFTESPPPAYRRNGMNIVRVTRMVCLTVLALAFLTGFFIIASNFVKNRQCDCRHNHSSHLAPEALVASIGNPDVSPAHNDINAFEAEQKQIDQLLRGSDLEIEEEIISPQQVLDSEEVKLREETKEEVKEMKNMFDAEENLALKTKMFEDSLQEQLELIQKQIKLPADMLLGKPEFAGRDANCKVEKRQKQIADNIVTQAIIVTCDDDQEMPFFPQGPPPPSFPRKNPPPPLSLLGPIMKILASRPRTLAGPPTPIIRMDARPLPPLSMSPFPFPPPPPPPQRLPIGLPLPPSSRLMDIPLPEPKALTFKSPIISIVPHKIPIFKSFPLHAFPEPDKNDIHPLPPPPSEPLVFSQKFPPIKSLRNPTISFMPIRKSFPVTKSLNLPMPLPVAEINELPPPIPGHMQGPPPPFSRPPHAMSTSEDQEKQPHPQPFRIPLIRKKIVLDEETEDREDVSPLRSPRLLPFPFKPLMRLLPTRRGRLIRLRPKEEDDEFPILIPPKNNILPLPRGALPLPRGALPLEPRPLSYPPNKEEPEDEPNFLEPPTPQFPPFVEPSGRALPFPVALPELKFFRFNPGPLLPSKNLITHMEIKSATPQDSEDLSPIPSPGEIEKVVEGIKEVLEESNGKEFGPPKEEFGPPKTHTVIESAPQSLPVLPEPIFREELVKIFPQEEFFPPKEGEELPVEGEYEEILQAEKETLPLPQPLFAAPPPRFAREGRTSFLAELNPDAEVIETEREPGHHEVVLN